MKKKQEFFRGCLLGGAVGDALGRPVEFLTLDPIVRQYGSGGIQTLELNDSGKAEVTDDTQMTLFTAEGMLRAETRYIDRGICHPPSVVFYAYQRWMLTQGYPRIEEYDWIYNGWLLGVKELYARRAPGNACISSLSSKKQGSIKEPINHSKGCGGVMRVAPVGLFCLKGLAFDMAADIAALTHGNPSGYLSAGALASIVANIIEGQDIDTSVNNAMIELKAHENHEECTELMIQALELVKSGISDIEAIPQLGEGWVGEEALAISVYCALKYRDDFKKALIAAVNHSGDSDSTGAITGNILGAYLGLNSIPEEWQQNIELHDVILQVADDLLGGVQEGSEWWERYPGC